MYLLWWLAGELQKLHQEPHQMDQAGGGQQQQQQQRRSPPLCGMMACFGAVGRGQPSSEDEGGEAEPTALEQEAFK